MTCLLMDIGNNRIKVAHWDGKALSAHAAYEYHDGKLSACSGILQPDTLVYVASVASQAVNDDVIALVSQLGGTAPHFLQTQASSLGLINGYAVPAMLGVDRWLAMLAAYHQLHDNVCVVDCGSAVTIDLVREDGQHLGGMIVPGRSLQLQILDTNLANVKIQKSDFSTMLSWGSGTVQCAVSGGVACIVGAIEVAMRHAKQTLGCLPKLVLTGGDAKSLSGYLECPFEYQEHLVLRGVGLMVNEMNRVH